MPNVNLSLLAGAGAQFLDNNGDPLTGGKLYSYGAGTTTPKTTYTTVAGNVAHANPIILDSAGRVPAGGEIWLTDGDSYKFALYTSTDVLVATYDNITGNGSGILANLAAPTGSNLVGFSHAETYSQETVGLALQGFVNVKNAPFNAVGDGVADDTAAIQAAIDFLNPYVYSSPFNYQQGGGTVFLPKGMYRITDTIRLPDYVTLQGQGRSMWLGADRLNEPADGTIIFANFALTNKIAIDSAGYDTATGLRYTALTPRPNADYLSGAMTYTHGVGIKELAVKCNETNPIEVGIRLNGSPLSMMQDVAVWGFKTGYLSVACWCNEYNNIIGVNKQIGIYMGGNNACKVTGILDNAGLDTGKYSGFGGTDVTAANKPIWWNASDTIYCSTSIYLDGCRSIAFPEMTSQNGGRGLYANNSNFSFGTWYTEAYPFNADSTGVVNGADSKGVFSNWYHDSNGCTLLQHNYNFPVTILALSGIWGLLQGVDGTGPALLGQSTVRNYAFPDRNYDPRLVPLVPSVVNEIYVFENAGFGNNNFIGDIDNPVFNLFGATARLVNGKKNIIYLSNSVIDYNVYDELVWSGYDIEIRRYGPGAFQPTIQFQVATGGIRPGIRVENTTLKTFGVDMVTTAPFAAVANTDRMFGINGNSRIYFNDAAITVTNATTGVIQALAGNAFDLSITYISCAITGTGYLGAPSTTGTGIVSEAATKLAGASGISTIAAAVQANGYGANITVLKSHLV